MSEWKEYKLEEIAEIIGGGTPSTKVESYYGGNISWITPRDLTNYNNRFISKGERHLTNLGLKNSSARLLPANTVLMTSRAPIGYLAIATNEVCTNQGFKSLVIDPAKADYNFIYYLLKANMDSIKSLGTGTTFAEISGSVVKGLTFKIPSLTTQTTIAEILSSLDDKIELNIQINKNLEDLAQALFKQWFVDYEFPNENGEPYKSSGGEMVDSELGEIPKGWKVGKLVDIIDFNPTEKLEVGKEASYLDMSSLPTQGSWPEKPIQRIFKSGMKFRNGDTLFARITPCLENGKTAYIQCLNNNEIAWGSTEFIVMRPKDFWPKELAYLIARNEEFRKYAIQSMIGTSGRQRAQSSHLMNFEFIYPSDTKLIKQFADLLESLFFKIKSNSIENEYLSEIRDILLPKLISGEISISN